MIKPAVTQFKNNAGTLISNVPAI